MADRRRAGARGAPDHLGPGALARLERKYAALLALRTRRDGGAQADRAELARLARAFPGCLRELDRNRAATLARRLATVRALRARGGPPPRWLRWVARYHALLARTLAARARAAARPGRGAPPRSRSGRPSEDVLARVAAEFATSPGRVRRALFPPRRPAP